MQTCIFFPAWMDGRNWVYKSLDLGWGLVGSALIGGLLGGQKGGSQTVYQQTIPQRPTYTPEEEALRNYYIDMVYGRTGMGSPLQSLIGGYYGLPTTPAITSPTGMAVPWQTPTGDLRSQYEAPIVARETDEALILLDDFNKFVDNKSDYIRKYGIIKYNKQTTKMQQKIADNLGISAAEASQMISNYRTNPTAVKTQIAELRPPVIGEAPQQTRQGPLPTPEYVTPEGTETPTTQQPFDISQLPPESPLAQIMGQTPEAIEAQFEDIRQQQLRGLQDWYSQATREASQRGITAMGGYEGSATARDRSALAADFARQQTELNTQIDMAKRAAIQQQPYNMLQALEDIRRWEASNVLAQQAPWIGVGQQIMGAPWGQSTTGTTQQPGPGILPGALAGITTYGLGSQLGWWNTGGSSAATPWGMGSYGPNLPGITGQTGLMPGMLPY